jgi:hypothetical protein
MQSHAIRNEYHCKPIDALGRGLLTPRSRRPGRAERAPEAGPDRVGASGWECGASEKGGVIARIEILQWLGLSNG